MVFTKRYDIICVVRRQNSVYSREIYLSARVVFDAVLVLSYQLVLSPNKRKTSLEWSSFCEKKVSDK